MGGPLIKYCQAKQVYAGYRRGERRRTANNEHGGNAAAPGERRGVPQSCLPCRFPRVKRERERGRERKRARKERDMGRYSAISQRLLAIERGQAGFCVRGAEAAEFRSGHARAGGQRENFGV
ncbi:uncharacterized protein PV09_06063 [Verruconis gallopava]|uniref:Uncharacterized protein n=1 Tax=Verruconis gallopava TaxID=253628 RepID=A0A0D1XJY7_9PEZI|nr:uncharacterized protein PV09_06063 [Verruconis gallopava]KIW02616.1 hypothetical protein PV09_06063 [Verruconis gallopava]